MAKYGTNIVIKNKLKAELDGLMTHPRDTYGIVIQKLVDEHKSKKIKCQGLGNLASYNGSNPEVLEKPPIVEEPDITSEQ